MIGVEHGYPGAQQRKSEKGRRRQGWRGGEGGGGDDPGHGDGGGKGDHKVWDGRWGEGWQSASGHQPEGDQQPSQNVQNRGSAGEPQDC